MASAEAPVCNLALLRIGQLQTIDSLADPTTPGKACAVLYAAARDAVLERRPWPFATRRATLATLSTGARGQWSVGYTVPSDCIAPRYLFNGTDEPTADELVPYAVENDAVAGKLILTNLSGAVLVYTAQIIAPPLWSPLFTDCLAWKLAADLCLALPKKGQLWGPMMQAYERSLETAAAAALNQQQATMPEADSAFVRGR